MISVDRNKCVRCGSCIRDCVVEVLKTDSENYPYLAPELEKYCLNCQHCLAVCPTGAVSCNGVQAEQCFPISQVAEPEKMLALIRQRRTVRFFKDENVSPEILEKLIGGLFNLRK